MRVKNLNASTIPDLSRNLRRVEDAVNALYDGDGDGSRYANLVVPASSFRPPGTSDPAWNGTEVAWSFTGTAANNVLHGAFYLPTAYKEGTSIKVYSRSHWTTSPAGQKAKFNLLYKWHNLSASISSVWTTAVQKFVLSQTVNTAVRLEFSIAGTNRKILSEFKFQFERRATDASDSFGDQVFVDALGLQYVTDKQGSEFELSK